MSKVTSIRDHLASRFTQRRLVIWHDAEGNYAADLDAHIPTGVTALRVENNEFALKHRVLREDRSKNYLIYRSGQIPEGPANWLLDLELAYGIFTADRGALMRADLGLSVAGAEELIAAHDSFFVSGKLVAKFKVLLRDDDDLVTVQAKMCAVVLGQKEHSFSELMRTLLVEYANGGSAGYDALVDQGLAEFHWNGAAKIYGYEAERPSMAGFVLWMFRQAAGGFTASTSGATRNIEIDFRSFRDNRQSTQALKTLARQAEKDLDYTEQISTISLDELVASDVFDSGEKEIILRLINAIVTRTMSERDITDTIRSRRMSMWFDDYATLYTALDAAAELLPLIKSTQLDIQTFDQGLTRYRDEWYRIDQLYRQFTHAAHTAEFKQPLEILIEQVEKAYVNDFLYRLGTTWQQQVDTIDQWESPVLTSQGAFFDHYVAPIIHGGRKKAVVIISDAMRYEVADELHARIRGENKYEAQIEAMLGVLPSYTQLGMASLLPHQALAHSPDGDPVLVDGQRSNGTSNRAKILAAVGGTAIQAGDFLKLKPSERRDLYSAHQVLYVYHDTIDATGDKAVSERRTFTAAAEAIEELISLVKSLASANATNILLTADHGFLYQDGKLPTQFNLTVKPQGDDIVAEKRRYVLGRELKNDPAFRKFQPEQLGLTSDLEVQIPNSIHRITQPGAGSQFVHGGASLQEIIVPVITVNKRRVDTVEQVNVDIHPETDKITTGQVVVKLYQSMPATDQRLARRLRAGVYFGEKLISNQVELLFDHTSREGRDRFQSVVLLLSKDADQANNHSVEFRLEQPIPGTDEWKRYKSAPYTIKRSFTSDFDF